MIQPPVNPFRLPERQHVVNVFVDLCGSTAAGERLEDTRQLFELLDRWQRLAAFVFCNYGGRIGASDSDMVMGYFIGSEAKQLAVSRAVLAAVRIREQTTQFGASNGAPLDVHIGLHCGDVELGAIGPDVRHNVTTIGPTVNIAARLESKADKGEIFVSGEVANRARLRWDGDHAGAYLLKGVSQPVECYRVKAVVLPSEAEADFGDADWIVATLEAQALEEVGRVPESLDLARRAARRPGVPDGLDPMLGLLSRELCIRGCLALRRTDEASGWIAEFANESARLAARREQARASFYRAGCLVQQARTREAITAFDNATGIYERHGTGRDVGDSLYYAGVCHQLLSDEHRARDLFAMARKTYVAFIEQREADRVETGKACLELSLLLDDVPDKAVDVLARAQKIFQDTCQFRHLLTVFLNMSAVAIRMRLFTDAENYARRALDLARDFDPVAGAGLAHGNIGAAMENRGELTQARAHYENALSIAVTAGDAERCAEMRARIRGVDRRRGAAP